MIVISKEEAKMLRKKFPGVHMVTTVNKTMVDELPYVLQALPNNYFAQEALAEMERDKHRTGIVNTRGAVPRCTWNCGTDRALLHRKGNCDR